MMFAGANKFRSGNDNVDEFAGLDQAFNLLSVQRELREADKEEETTSQLKTVADAEYIFKYLLKKHADFCTKAEPSNKYYKIKFVGTDNNSNPLEFTAEIKKVDDEVNVLDFQKVRGSALPYFETINKIKEQVAAF